MCLEIFCITSLARNPIEIIRAMNSDMSTNKIIYIQESGKLKALGCLHGRCKLPGSNIQTTYKLTIVC